MQFNGHATKQDIISDITFLTGVDINAFRLVDRTRSVNERFRQIWYTIFEAYGGWKFMDDNQSDVSTGVPYATQNVTSGTGLYALPSGSLAVNGVEILTSSGGSWNRIQPLTEPEFMKMNGDGRFSSTGTPIYYMLQGDVIRLLPTPNFTVSSALRVFFDQGITAFSSTDTTATPGFASPFHRALSVGAALDYAIAKGLDKKNDLQNLWEKYLMDISAFYAKRWADRQPGRIPPRRDLWRSYK